MSEQNNTEMTFQIQRIYTKDISFEAPNAPHIFQKEWQPEVKLDLDTASTQLAEGVYEVVLRVTVTASPRAKRLASCVKYSRAVSSPSTVSKVPRWRIALVHTARTSCSRMRVSASPALVSRGTFPQLNLAPVNFDALFMNYLQQQTGEGAEQHQDA